MSPTVECRMLAIVKYVDQHGFPAPESVMHLERRLGMTGGVSGGTGSVLARNLIILANMRKQWLVRKE